MDLCPDTLFETVPSHVGKHRSVPLLNPGGVMNMPEKMEFRVNLHNALPQNRISIVNLFREVSDENICVRRYIHIP